MYRKIYYVTSLMDDELPLKYNEVTIPSRLNKNKKKLWLTQTIIIAIMSGKNKYIHQTLPPVLWDLFLIIIVRTHANSW